jgi:hypothetical protein
LCDERRIPRLPRRLLDSFRRVYWRGPLFHNKAGFRNGKNFGEISFYRGWLSTRRRLRATAPESGEEARTRASRSRARGGLLFAVNAFEKFTP